MKKLLLLTISSSLIFVLSPMQAFASGRIGMTLTNGNLYIKEGSTNAPWHQLTSGVNIGEINLTGNYIGVVDKGSDSFSIKQPYYNSQFNMLEYGTAKDSAIVRTSDGNYRMVILKNDGSVVMKDGVWNSGYWSGSIATGVSKIVVGGDNVGLIMSNKDFKAKKLTPGQFSHPDNVQWQLVEKNVTKGEMTNDRIAIINTSDNVKTKEGGITGSWTGGGVTIFSFASIVRIAGNRICAITNPGQLRVECKEGSLMSAPKLTYLGASDFKLSTTRFLALKSNGNAEVMEGSLSQNTGWMPMATGNASKIELEIE